MHHLELLKALGVNTDTISYFQKCDILEVICLFLALLHEIALPTLLDYLMYTSARNNVIVSFYFAQF